MKRVQHYFSLVKFSHTIFAMPFALIGFFLGILQPFKTAGARFTWGEGMEGKRLLLLFLLVVMCMVFARSAAMAFNRWLDAGFDRLNPRTAIREIPSGVISKRHALLFVIANSVAFVACTWFINTICFILSPLALFIVLFYSYTKRFTPLCHLVLGLGLSLAPIGAYLAVTGFFSLLPLLFSFSVIFWVSGFDIIYALQDDEFDKSQQLYSIPVWIGRPKALLFSSVLHFLSAACVIVAGIYGHFGISYWVGVMVFTGMLVYQHSLVKPTDLSRVNLAFMTSNGIASVVFSIFVITDLLLS